MLGHDQKGARHEDDGDRDDDAGLLHKGPTRPQDGEGIEDGRHREPSQGLQSREPVKVRHAGRDGGREQHLGEQVWHGALMADVAVWSDGDGIQQVMRAIADQPAAQPAIPEPADPQRAEDVPLHGDVDAMLARELPDRIGPGADRVVDVGAGVGQADVVLALALHDAAGA